MRTTGIVTLIVGGLVCIGAIAVLDWLSVPEISRTAQGISVVPGHGVTLWDVQTRLPGSLTVIAAAAVALAATSLLLRDSVLAVLAPTCFAFLLLGETFPLGVPDYSGYEVGFWLANASALAMSAGGVLAVAATAGAARRAGII